MKIRNKITAFFVAAFVITIIFTNTVVSYYSASVLTEDAKNHLDTAAKSRSDHIITYLTAYKRRISMLASGVIFKDLLETSPSDPDYQEYLGKVNFRITDPRDHLEFDSFTVMDINGVVITSSNKATLGTDKSKKLVFVEGKEGAFVNDIHLSEAGDVTLSVSAPILSSEGNLLGVLSGKLDENTLYDVLTDTTGLGDTGETYLINQEGYFITPSRFYGEKVILTLKDESQNAKNCLSMKHHPEEHIGHEGTISSRGYQGQDVFASHVYISEMDWCLLAEINKEEALLPLRSQLYVQLGVSVIALSLIIAASYAVSRGISNPLEKLGKGVEIVEKGGLDYKIATDAKDEIGNLSRAFSKMVAALKESRKDVDKKVEEQTKEIRSYTAELQEQQDAMLNVLEDVEEEKTRATEERDRLDTILRSIGDGVFVVDKDLNVIRFNPAAEVISGYSFKELEGKNISDNLKFISEKDSRPADGFILEAIRTKKPTAMSNHTFLVRKDGEKVSVADSAAPLMSIEGETIGCVVVFRDVTEEREIDRMKTEFLSVAAHQLRTPLGSMRWNMEMVLSGDTGKVEGETKDVLDQVYESNKRLILLVNDLLDSSRIEEGRVENRPSPTDVVEVVNKTIKELSPEAEEKDVEVTFQAKDPKIEITIDPRRLREAVQNVITNAIKYNKSRGKVEVKVEKQKEDLLICVKDTGIGISEKDKNKLFSKFFRADNAVRSETEGSGLGLFVVRSYVEAWGGSVDFESKEGEGSRFCLRIPLKPKRGDISKNLKDRRHKLK